MKLNTIFAENCLDTMAKMPEGFVDLVVTSPPYDDLRTYDGYSFKFELVAEHLFRVIADGGVVVWVVGDQSLNFNESGNSFKQALFFQATGFNLLDTMIYSKPAANGARMNRHIYIQAFEYMFVFSKGKPKTINLIHDRPNLSHGRHLPARKIRDKDGVGRVKKAKSVKIEEFGRRTNIWYYATGQGASTKDKIAQKHPAVFPEQLAADHIKSWSNKGDLVYDPFMGSGTTAKMALLLDRKYLGSEISKKYCWVAAKRLKPYINQTKML